MNGGKSLAATIVLLDVLMVGALAYGLSRPSVNLATLPGGVKVEVHQLAPNITAFTDVNHPLLDGGYTQTNKDFIFAFTLPRVASDTGIGEPWIQLNFMGPMSLLTPTAIYVNGSAVPFIYSGVNLYGNYALGWWPGNVTSNLVFSGPGTFLVVMAKP